MVFPAVLFPGASLCDARTLAKHTPLWPVGVSPHLSPGNRTRTVRTDAFLLAQGSTDTSPGVAWNQIGKRYLPCNLSIRRHDVNFKGNMAASAKCSNWLVCVKFAARKERQNGNFLGVPGTGMYDDAFAFEISK